METYIPRDLTPVEAVQWDGSRVGGNKIIDWIRRENMNARWSDWGGESSYSIDVVTDEMSFTVYQNDWVVYEPRVNGEKSFSHMVTFEFEQRFRKPEHSKIVEHAERELNRIDEDEAVKAAYLQIVRIFADLRPSGGMASVFIPTLGTLLNQEHITSLTDDPEEWVYHDETKWEKGSAGVWQNKRNGNALSEDGGKTYFLVDDPAQGDDNERIMYDSMPHDLMTETEPGPDA